MKSLFYKYSVDVNCAYIITIKGNQQSEWYSKRCQESCKAVDMNYKVWDAFDGTGGEIRPPEDFKDDRFFKSLKITNHYITRTEVAATLSHMSLWLHCAAIDEPIVVLEHDAIVVKKFTSLDSMNSIVYLGGEEWYKDRWPIYPIPPHGSDGPNNHFILRAHAYAIDPQIAKNLLAYKLKYGISGAPDILMRTDLFNVTHQGFYAYDNSLAKDRNQTTIVNRDLLIPSVRNDKLDI